MATIDTMAKVQSNYTDSFSSLANGANRVVSSFETLNRSLHVNEPNRSMPSNAGINNSFQNNKPDRGVPSFETNNSPLVNNIGNMPTMDSNQGIVQMGDAFNGVQQQIIEATSKQEALNDAIVDGEKSSGGLWNKFKGLAASKLNFDTVGQIFNLSDQMTNSEAKLALIVDDHGSVEDLKKRIYQSAIDARTGYQQTTDFVTQLGMSAKGAFANNDEMVDFANQINKNFVIAGASTEQMNAATSQIVQALSSGTLEGEQFNSILSSAPGIIDSIAQYMNLPNEQIKQMASEGQLSAGVLKDAMLSNVDETNKKFESMPKTWGQQLQLLESGGMRAFEVIHQKLNELANSEGVQAIISVVLAVLPIIAGVVAQIFGVIGGIADFVVRNWQLISPIILGVVGVMGAYLVMLGLVKAAELIEAGVKGASTLASNVHKAAMAMETEKTLAATAAQYGLNAALLACPIFWIVIGFILLIVAVFAAVAIFNYFTGSSVSGLGVICGAINVVIQFFWNLILVIQNIGIFVVNFANGCKNVFFALVDNIVIAFRNGIKNVQAFFYDLAAGALDVVAQIADGLNNLPFVSIDVKGIKNSASDYAKKAQAERDSKEKYKDIGAEFEKGMNTLKYNEVFKSGWVEDAYSSGYKFGEKAQNSIGDFMGDLFKGDSFDMGKQNKMDDYMKNMMNQSNNLNNMGNKDASRTANNTDKMVQTGEEDLKYLRDIAERDAINRFTTAEIKVEMTNNNNINSEIDLNGIVNKLTSKVEEQMYISAEGVHA